MKQQISESELIQTIALLNYYCFDLKGYLATELITLWLQKYQLFWIRLAVIEALYQGRYKAVSVEQILQFWLRRNEPLFHFTHDFERLICRKLPQENIIISEDLKENIRQDFDENFAHEVKEETVKVESQNLENIPISENNSLEIKEKMEEHSKNTEVLPSVNGSSSHNVLNSIDKFNPDEDLSLFYLKLKKFAIYRLIASQELEVKE